MKISKFVSKQNTTLDTVKYYIKIGLLTPDKENHIYNFSPKEEQDFQNILYLKSLGFSLDLIRQIKINHEKNCGTKQQWYENLKLIEQELEGVQLEKEKLRKKEELLFSVKQELLKKLEHPL